MNFLEKLKTDRQDLISKLCDNIDSLERIALEQQAEIERLEKENVKLHTIIPKMIVEAKAEAIKDFWEKIKKYCKREVCFFTPQDERELIKYGNNLVKEMVGDEE